MNEKFPEAEAFGQLKITEKEDHPAWPVFIILCNANNISIMTGTEWVVPWMYFSTGYIIGKSDIA